ncbi:hypothetical protein [uncultured Methylibium sp.]|uniref:hypothetical protein n=1 Tax=uncultured Methylibium sp. TaxID=381093 RepID=UPI0025E8300D|nr:hypothetical protein [uncultured Methylibium sp.]
MNFGGPIDLTPFGSVLTSIGVVYWLLAAIAVVIALAQPKTTGGKAWATGIVLVVFGAMPVSGMWQQHKAHSRWKEAMALFEQRCKSAGERITRTVENVEGVVWMKWREPGPNLDDQFKLDDPYGQDCWGEGCLIELVRVTRGVQFSPEGAKQHQGAYAFVETIDPKDGRWYRYFGAMKLPPSWTAEGVAKLKREEGKDPPSFSYRVSFEREPIDKPTARYGITWDDISTREDREHWIAGGSLKAIDLSNNEVIAERRGYMVDRGQGAGRQGSFRSPWGFAAEVACPPKLDAGGKRTQVGFTARFANKVLQPIKRE